ncbi:MAG: hypothetical protein HY050_00305 [Actinobacteria bacterium]|nr:hypothetical protein [Actinomycetota bacterium]
MKRLISSIVISALAVVGGAVFGGAPAFAAATPSTLVISGGNATFGLDPAIITATANNAGTVKFTAVGVVIKGCEAVATTTAAPFVAKCTWLPAAAGPTLLGGTFSPTDAVNFTPVDAVPFTARVGVPVQGVVSPISIFVDTVLASGSTGVLAPRFGVSCAVTSQFILGQTIVFRVYGNNGALGGAALDSSNTAKAYIEVAGIKDPIPLSYGNHSGVSFWVGVLATGTAAGKYSTLGVVNFKVTMVAKDQSKIKVLSTKLTRKIVNGVQVKENGSPVYERVSYYRNVTVNPPLKGAVGTWQSNFTSNSQVTVYAVPTA